MSIQEHVILVNDQGMVIGTQEKYAAHTTQTPLHLAFSSWLFNAEGECLVTRRALSKKAWPGVWTNSVCGHPQTGEKDGRGDLSAAAAMRLALKSRRLPPVAAEFRYRETDPSGVVENEICPVFAARITSELRINHEEVMEFEWVELESLFQALNAAPWGFSPWMVLEATVARDALRAFAAQ